MSQDVSDDGVSRRSVLRSTGAAAAAFGIGGGGGLAALNGSSNEEFSINESFVGENRTVDTVCSPNCRGKCPLKVHVRDGTVKKIEPQIPDDPQYKRACVLGLSHTQRAYDPTRLKFPMKRADWSPENPNPQGRGPDAEFERIEWDEALDLVAEKMESVQSEYGEESLLFHEC